MSNDLISRSALKKYKFTTTHANGVELEDIEVVSVVAIDNAPPVDIQKAVWELYKRHQPRLAINVYEFGLELKDLLDRYGRVENEDSN